MITGNLDTHSGDLDGTATTPDTFLKQAEILSMGGQSSTAGLGQFLFNLGTTSTATSGIGFLASKVIGGLDLDLQLSALEAISRGRVLLAPKVTTMDKREAQISVDERSHSRLPRPMVLQHLLSMLNSVSR